MYQVNHNSCNKHHETKKILVNAALGLFDEGSNMKFAQGFVTSNVAFKKEIFDKIRFDDSIGASRRGRLILCGEDTDFCNRINRHKLPILYTPYARVFHQVQNKRVRVPYILKHAIHNGLTRTRMTLKEFSRFQAIRLSASQLIQYALKMPFDPSFTSCYNLVYGLSTFLVTLTGVDNLFS